MYGQSVAALEPLEAAKSAGLRYILDSKPGIRRIRPGRSFRYTDEEGNLIHSPAVLDRMPRNGSTRTGSSGTDGAQFPVSFIE
jgi:hypothetical protein